MIVTKEIAAQRLIRRNAWFIETAANGDLKMVYKPEHWKEGMELFETQEECSRELEKRIIALMKSGHCPRCNYKHVTETDKDVSHLKLVAEPKGSKLYQCPECKSVWFTRAGLKFANAYDQSLLDYLVEWGGRNLQPSKEQQAVLHAIGNVSVDSDFSLYPAHVILKSGFELPTAIIRLQNNPPTPRQFNRNDWHYFDLISEIRPSAYAYPPGITKEILKHLAQGKHEFIYLQDNDSKKTYSFDPHAGIFTPEELKGKDLMLFKSKGDLPDHTTYFVPADRGGPDHWNLTPAPREVTILGDSVK